MTTRRAFTVGAAALLTGAVAAARAADSAGAARAAVLRLDAADAANLHRLYRRVRFAPDDRIVFWWMKGRRYGLVDNALTPFFDMHVGSMHRCVEIDGGYRLTTASAMYFSPVGGDELLEQWDNPITGKRVEFRYPAPAPSVSDYSYVSGPQEARGPGMPGMRSESHHLLDPVDRVGADLWIREESHLVLTPERTDAGLLPMRVHDTYTFQAPAKAVTEAGARFVPANCQFNDFNSWSPRFQMGGRPGTSLSRCAGRKESRLDDLPATWLKIARRVHPDALRDPARLLG